MASINDVVASLKDKLQPFAPRAKKPALPDGFAPAVKRAPTKQKAAPAGARVVRGVAGEQRRDKRTVREVSSQDGVIVVRLQAGTGPLARGLDMLNDALTNGIDGFPVQVVQGGKTVASQMKPIDPGVALKVSPIAAKGG